MAGAPRFKVYRRGQYVAACKDVYDALAVVAVGGGNIRDGHKASDTVWTEGVDISPNESYDAAAILVEERIQIRGSYLDRNP